MIRKLALLLLLAPTLSLLVSCGDDEAPTPARQRCEVDGAAYFGQGQLALADDATSAVQLEGSSAPGLISGATLVVRMASVTVEGQRYPLLLRLHATDEATDLLNRVSRATIDGPLTVTIADASMIASGANNISGLARYDCDLAQGRLCAQLAVDRDLDGLVSDADQMVYNARSGELRFTRAVSSRFVMDWSLEVGANMFERGASTPGALAGCVNAQYRQGLGGAWELF